MRSLLTALVLFVAALPAALGQAAHPFLSPLFSDNMVLQRDRPIPVWGWTEPGKQVTVRLQGKSASATADSSGKWLAHLPAMRAGGPYKLTVSGPQDATLDNVLVGDVWVCSGQSNMEMGIGNVNNAQQEIASASYPQIRLFTVAKTIAYSPRTDLTVRDADLFGKWSVCTPETIKTGGWNGFSAVAYFFGRELYNQLHIPIGLIHTSWGGTPAEAWTSAEALAEMPDFRPALSQIEQMRASEGKPSDLNRETNAWYAKNDPGSANGLGWADPAVNAAGWKTMSLPNAWEDAGLPDFDGVVWFRKEVDLPESAAGKEAMLHLGPIDDRDTTWVNGTRVGGLNEYNVPRNYRIPAGVLKAGKNVIAVRVLDTGGAGGLNGTPNELSLAVSGNPPISLAGPWSYQVGVDLKKAPAVPIPTNNNPNIVSVLYNGMISPLLPYGIKGAIWYQGESNAGRSYQYRTLLPTMIKDWRARWGEGDFPFYIVQLANFLPPDKEPQESGWAELREAQLMTTQTVPNTAEAVIIDIGDAADIHPKNKQDVGKRLALDALALTYGKNVEYSGPAYKSMKKEGSAIRLTFTHAGGGLVAKGDKLTGFAIAGPDHHFVWANAAIDGDTVIVSSPQVPDPVAVRYAWSNNPAANLYNKAGLPASPFRTDDWPGVTANNR